MDWQDKRIDLYVSMGDWLRLASYSLSTLNSH